MTKERSAHPSFWSPAPQASLQGLLHAHSPVLRGLGAAGSLEQGSRPENEAVLCSANPGGGAGEGRGWLEMEGSLRDLEFLQLESRPLPLLPGGTRDRALEAGRAELANWGARRRGSFVKE